MPDDERELVRRLREGDLAAFDSLFAAHRGALLAYAAGMLGDRALAEDVVQDAFIELARCADRLDPDRGVKPWLFRVARNRAFDILRRREPEQRAHEASALAAEETGDVRTPADDLAGLEARQEMAGALARLPPREREVLVMHYFGDCSFKEIAAVMRRPLGTVLWQSRRALRRLASALSPRQHGGGGV